MKTYRIRECFHHCVVEREFEVEAPTEEEALRLHKEGLSFFIDEEITSLEGEDEPEIEEMI